MKKSITRTPQSEEDAYSTYRHIALDSVDAAEAYFEAKNQDTHHFSPEISS